MQVRLTKPRSCADGVLLTVGTILGHPLYGREKHRNARVEQHFRDEDKSRMLFWMRDGTAEPADDEAEEAFAEHRKTQEVARERQDEEDAAHKAWQKTQVEKATAERHARFERRLLAGTLPPQREREPEATATPEPEPPSQIITVTPDEAAAMLTEPEPEPEEEETDDNDDG